jgi:uncharacterized membrane protein
MGTTAPQIHALADAPWFVLLHLALALCALGAGTVMLARRKGDVLHRRLGWVWATVMVGTALVSFAIQARGRFSAIHVLSVVVLVTVPLGIVHIRRGRVHSHRITMISTFAGLAIAGAFTLLPYRMLGQLVFGAR